MKDGITLNAIFVRATTTSDGGWRISFDVSSDEARSVLQLSQMRDSLLQLGILPVDAYDEESDEPK